MHKATQRFWNCFENIPEHIQKTARKKFQLLKENPSHPSLHFKKIGEFWSARVGRNYRALAIKDDADFIWVWIGTHQDYDKLLNR